jgi:hypothetical protein
MGTGLPTRKAKNQLLFTTAILGGTVPPKFSSIGGQMGEVVQFIPKRDLDQARLIQEARAIYESIFPTQKGPAGLQRVYSAFRPYGSLGDPI